jgi:hypothetical protein
MSSRPNRRRWAARAVAAIAALLVLTACNPIQKPLRTTGGISGVNVAYDGPAGAWLEVSSSGGAGFDVRFRALLWLNGFGERSSRDAATGAVEPCVFEMVLVMSDWFPATPAYQSVFSPLDGDEPIIEFECSQGGSVVVCPDSIRVNLRTVDDDGDLVGDLN